MLYDSSPLRTGDTATGRGPSIVAGEKINSLATTRYVFNIIVDENKGDDPNYTFGKGAGGTMYCTTYTVKPR